MRDLVISAYPFWQAIISGVSLLSSKMFTSAPAYIKNIKTFLKNIKTERYFILKMWTRV
jgi:hypothetical protein